MDSVFNCLDVLLWLLRQSKDSPKATTVHAHWDLQNPDDPDTIELRATVGVKFNTGCLLNLSAACTALTHDSVHENIKIFGSEGVLRYRREVISRTNMASGQLTFQSSQRPYIKQELVPEGQGQGLRTAPLADFLRCLIGPEKKLESPARDSIAVLEIIEKAYQSARNGGVSIQIT